MAPKADKAKVQAKQKAAEDKTFGLKVGQGRLVDRQGQRDWGVGCGSTADDAGGRPAQLADALVR
jgi:hypothetical protein